jgi:hypothetical protein
MAKHKRKCRKESGAIKREIGEKQEHLERERESVTIT